MNPITLILLIVAAVLLPVALSIIVEALRKTPQTPTALYWDPATPIRYTDINGVRIRHIRTGHGPNLVLLHTLRTQLDIFQKVIPALARDFTVHALDYPGHGFSDIPDTQYRPELFVASVEGFLEKLDIRDAVVAGVSIGGSIPLLIAARRNARVRKVVAINPYDYAGGNGVARGNIVAWLVFTLARFPVLGETVMRFRNRLVERLIMQGGVAHPESLPHEFLEQMYTCGERKGHYRAFVNLIRNFPHWEDGHAVYGQIQVPVLVIYGDRDWSRPDERRRTVAEIPGARMETVRDGSHFLPLDQPDRVVELIRNFARA